MKNLKIQGHAPYVGETGYNQHARGFFRALSKQVPVKVRNTTVGKTWKGLTNDPHGSEPYWSEEDRRILNKQVLVNTDGSRSDFEIYAEKHNGESPTVDLVLGETGDPLFYDRYQTNKVAYNVWESTLQPENFFNKLKEFRQLWVPTKWQKECSVRQGYPEEKIRVIREGLDPETLKPENIDCPLVQDGRFKFLLAGKWEYRKATEEIIRSFLNTFKPEEPVDLIISVDNPFSKDGLGTTEKRLAYHSLTDPRIKVLHFPPRDQYLALLKSCHAFVSCSRSEGWNIPLMEAMACGVPAIYSNCSGQLEFAEGRGVPVRIIGESPALECVGNYYKPDFEDLERQMRAVVANWSFYKERALIESDSIREEFKWEHAAEAATEAIKELAVPEKFDLGWLKTTDLKTIVPNEIFVNRVYERVYQVAAGDIVLDIGASSGPFTQSILEKKPAHVFCLEPGADLFRTLNKNMRGRAVTPINRAIGADDYGFFCKQVYGQNAGFVESISFKTLLERYHLDRVDFIKLDCEGGEYHVFTEEYLPFLKGVPKIAGEWHLESPEEKKLFRAFRDTILPQFKKVEVFACSGENITDRLSGPSFIEFYRQIVIHIGN